MYRNEVHSVVELGGLHGMQRASYVVLMESHASKPMTDGKRLTHLGHELCEPGAFSTRGYRWRPKPHSRGLQLRPEADCLLQPTTLHSPHATVAGLTSHPVAQFFRVGTIVSCFTHVSDPDAWKI